MIKKYHILVLLMSFFLLLSFSCSNQKQPDNSYFTRIIHLDHLLAFPEIVKELNNYQWGKQNDPQMLMIYCGALRETNQDLTEFLKKNSLAGYQRDFAKGYYDLISGNYRDADAKFLDLTGTEDGRIWGYIGILEYALYTQNIVSLGSYLGSPLQRLKEAAENNPLSVPSWVIPYYSAWYSFYTFNFSQDIKILEKQGYYKELGPLIELTLKMQLFIKDNNLGAAEETFKTLSEPLSHYQSIIALWSSIIKIRRGPEEAAKFLAQKHKLYPLAWKIEREYAQALIDAGQVQAGLDMLKKLAERRPFDLMLQLQLAEDLLVHERGKGVIDIFRKFQNPIEIPSYNTLLAVLEIKYGREKKARERINFARLVYPKCPSATWATFWLEEKKNNYKKAEQALNDILDLDPHEVQALGDLVKINYLTGKYEDVISNSKKIIDSGRFIPVELSDKIDSYQALVWASRGKHDKANGFLNKITNSELRAKTTDAIKKENTDRKSVH
jgi:hypothetical protein